VPYICNEKNRIYPQLGEIRLSQPYEIQEMVEDYLKSLIKLKRRKKINGESLSKWLNSEANGLRPCVELILYGTLNSAMDGTKRLMFILANELKRVYGSDKAIEMLKIWNDKLDNPILESELEYRIYKNKEYTLTCGFISKLLKELGFGHLCEKCKHKP